jgi:hypothetical protein
MLKIAVLYTGELRTIEKTLPYFRQNILNPTGGDVFATLQRQGETTKTNIETTLGQNLKSLDWFEREHYNELQDSLLHQMEIDSRWKHYLKTSGSMIEYYQLYLSFMKMREHEEMYNFKYDYVIRLRTDVLVVRPLEFPTSLLEQGGERWIKSGKSISKFMSSVFSLNRILSNEILEENVNVNDPTLAKIGVNSTANSTANSTIEELKEYLDSGDYLITIRKNVFYIGKRGVFDKIVQLGIMYGYWRSPKYENWFDAESQLETICEHYNISIFNSMSRLEGNSLYQYKTENYFNQEGGLLDLPSVFCFICRL